ncbi:MAG: diguanylate cyclase, partial [Burkholderiales bacterium]|nr:diguanylate cyclase [Burkholderiales bacterium]
MAGLARRSIRPSDTLARISGDEFLLLINPLERAEDLRPLIDRVIDALKQPFQIEGHELLTSASVGVAVCPLH